MKVILLESIPNVGGFGEVANVRAGYARNYLFPSGKAEPATEEAVKNFESRRAELEKRQQERTDALSSARDALDGYLLQIPAHASADGSLYGSVTPAAVAVALNAAKIIPGIDVRRGQVNLPAGNLKEVGDHEASVSLGPGIAAKITVAVLSGAAGMDAETSETMAEEPPAAETDAEESESKGETS